MVNVPDLYYAGQPAASRVPLYRPVALLVIVRVHGYGPRSRFIRCANFALTVAGTQGEESELSGDALAESGIIVTMARSIRARDLLR